MLCSRDLIFASGSRSRVKCACKQRSTLYLYVILNVALSVHIDISAKRTPLQINRSFQLHALHRKTSPPLLGILCYSISSYIGPAPLPSMVLTLYSILLLHDAASRAVYLLDHPKHKSELPLRS